MSLLFWIEGSLLLFLPYMKRLIKKELYVKFTNKINVLTINKAQNKSFAQGPQIFQDSSDFRASAKSFVKEPTQPNI